MALAALNLKAWIDENRHLLKPPVGNKCIWENGDYIVMVVGGPNSRKDYHYNKTPEFFYQVEGDINLKIIEEGKPRTVTIKEGEVFLLPAGVPHSPQRGPNTVGLVVETKRPKQMKDAMLWFCEDCGTKLYEEKFYCDNIETDLPRIMKAFYGDEALRTCRKCKSVMQPPVPPKID
jgi:3-hydroxyanthranilate 3,4-dioxygenase